MTRSQETGATSQSISDAECEACGARKSTAERTCGRDECLARVYGEDILDGLDSDLRKRALIALEGK